MTAQISPPTAVRDTAARWLSTCLVIVLLTQRLVIPIGSLSLPVGLLMTLPVVALGIARGVFTLRRDRVRSYALVLAVATLVSSLNLLLGEQVAVGSLLLLALIYSFAVLNAPSLSDDGITRILRVFYGAMTVAAVVAIAQFGVQYAGIPSTDWLAELVPPHFLLVGYNTGDSIYYGSDLIRSNGVLFAEPSFLSFFLGVAMTIALTGKVSRWPLLVMAAAILTTVAGNGIVVVLAGAAIALFGPHRRRVAVFAGIFGLILVLAIPTSLASTVLGRAGEVAGSGSSSSQRLIEPYEILVPSATEGVRTLLLGRGAGYAESVIERSGVPGVLAPVVPKLLVEYGMIGLLAFIVFIAPLLGRAKSRSPWTAGILIGYYLLNAALLQFTLAYCAIFFLVLLRPERQDETFDARVFPWRSSAHRASGASRVT